MAKKYRGDLEKDEQEMLTGLVTSGIQRARKITHAHILLRASSGWTDQQISEALNVSVPTVERVRQQFVEEGLQQAVHQHFPNTRRCVLVEDNLNPHTPAALYETFEPAKARSILDRLELHFTPKHGSWLNMAEIELSVLSRQCLSGHIPSCDFLVSEGRGVLSFVLVAGGFLCASMKAEVL